MKKLLLLYIFLNNSFADELDKKSQVPFNSAHIKFCKTAIEVKEMYKQTPSAIHCAAVNSNLKFIKEVLSAGANLELKNYRKETPIFLAIQNNKNPEVLKFLIKAGADINATAKKSLTPLFYAVSNNNLTATKILIDAGADVKYQIDGLTPITAAILVMTYKKDYDIEIIKLLIKSGVDIEAKAEGFGNQTALIMATEFENVEVVKLLLEKGANIYSSRDTKAGKSALDYAKEKNNPEIIKLFEEAKEKMEKVK